jgi:hypothetical protein
MGLDIVENLVRKDIELPAIGYQASVGTEEPQTPGDEPLERVRVGVAEAMGTRVPALLLFREPSVAHELLQPSEVSRGDDALRNGMRRIHPADREDPGVQSTLLVVATTVRNKHDHLSRDNRASPV